MNYKVKSGDWLSKIALKYGFDDGGAAIWDANPELREKSGNNPDVLQPRWIITIPEKKPRRYAGSSGNEYSLIRGSLAKNIVIILKGAPPDSNPVSGWNYTLRANGKELGTGKSDSEGKITARNIPEDISEAELELQEETLFGLWKFDPEKITIEVGGLDPIQGDTQLATEAVQKILTNLGYYRGEINGKFNPETRAAIRAFQSLSGIRPTHGLADEKTCEALCFWSEVSTAKPTAPEKGETDGQGDTSRKGDILKIGTGAPNKPEFVTPFSKYVEPTAKNQTQESRLEKFNFFPRKVFIPPSSSTGMVNGIRITMPFRKFIFLDVGSWIGDSDRDKRHFGLIYGRYVYLCRYLPFGGLKLDIPNNKNRLDCRFLAGQTIKGEKNPLAGYISVDQWADATWADDNEIDWEKLYIILPDTHFMTEENAKVWFGGIRKPWEYNFIAETDLLEFAKKLKELAEKDQELKSKICIIQMGDAYDLWVGYERKFEKDEEERQVILMNSEPDKKKICGWIRDIEGSGPNGAPNPGTEAFKKLDATFGEKGMIYLYGNHDNYLKLEDVCTEAGMPKRKPWYGGKDDGGKGVFMEHGHRMEARYVIKDAPLFGGSNYDGCTSGHWLVEKVYKYLKGTLPAVKKIEGGWTMVLHSHQYWGEQAQIWLGRQSGGDLKPPHIFVMAHTHDAKLKYINIHTLTWRIGRPKIP